MERRFLAIIIILFTVLVALGAWFILKEEANPVPLPEEERATSLERKGEDLPKQPEGSAEEAKRELIAPDQEQPQEEFREMPRAFREALGGFIGRVLDSEMTPVSDIPVEIYGVNLLDCIVDPVAYLEGDSFFFQPKVISTRTAMDGTFHLPGAYPRAFYVLSIDGEGTRSLARIIDHLPGPAETVDLGDIVLPPLTVLCGRVIDQAGEPVPGVRVRTVNLPPLVFLSGVQDYRTGGSFLVDMGRSFEDTVFETPPLVDTLIEKLPIPTTSTNADGAFRLEGVPPGLVTVLTDRDGFMTTQHGPISTAKQGEKDLGDLQIQTGTTLKGTVVDEAGKPLPGVEVRVGSIHSFKEFTVLLPPLVTDEEGAFSQSGIANHSAMVAARRHDLDPWTVSGPISTGSGMTPIILPTAYDVKFTFVDEEDEAVPEVAVKIKVSKGREDIILLNPHKAPGDRLERPSPGVVVLKDLGPANYEVIAFAAGYAIEPISFTIGYESLEKKVVLKAAHSVPIRVLTRESESPVEWAEVYSWIDREDFLLNPTRISRSRTDESGSAILKNLHAGVYQVTVSHPRYAVVSEKLEVPAEEEFVIHLEQGGAIEGVVYPGNSGHIPPYMLVLNPRYWKGSMEESTPRFTRTDSEGQFRITNLNAGTWRIHVQRTLFEMDPAGLFQRANLRSLHRYRAEVKAGETTHLEITVGSADTGPSSMVMGQVFLDGIPLEGARLTIWTDGQHEALTNSKGRYTLERVPTGDHRITLNIPIASPQGKNLSLQQRILVEENIPLYEDFYLVTGSLKGRVVDQVTEMACAGVFKLSLKLESEDSPYYLWVSRETLEDGSFHFEQIPIGVYTLYSTDSDLSCESVTGIKILPGVETGPVLVRRAPSILVEGRVDLKQSNVNDDWIFLYFQPADDTEKYGKSTEVNPDTGAFSLQNLPPGAYQVYLYSSKMRAPSKPIPLEIPPSGVTGLLLTFAGQ